MNIDKTFLLIVLAGSMVEGAGSISGTVVDPSGAVIPNSSVTLRAAALESHTRSDQAGRFIFPDLRPGRYSLEIVTTGFKTANLKSIRVRDEAVDEKSIVLRVAVAMGSCPESPPVLPTIEWREGAPGVDGIISVPTALSPSAITVKIRDTRGGQGASITPDATGRFSFPRLLSGTYSLRVHADGYRDFVIDRTTVRDEKRTIVMSPLPLLPCAKWKTCAPIKKIVIPTVCL